MEVTVIFDSPLRKYHPTGDKSLSVSVPDGASIRDLLDKLAVIPGEVGVIARNSQLANPDDRLEAGDILKIYQVIGGG